MTYDDAPMMARVTGRRLAWPMGRLEVRVVTMAEFLEAFGPYAKLILEAGRRGHSYDRDGYSVLVEPIQ